MDTFTKERRSEIMSSIRGKNTSPELKVRRLLHGLGYRFRLHRKDLPGKPDVVLRKHRTIVFVHGCFWHGCTKCDRGTRVPKTNTEFWLKKIEENCRRDKVARTALESSGWKVLTVWACETENIENLTNFFVEHLPRTTPSKSGP